MGKVCVRILYLSSLEKSLFKPRGIVWKPPKKQNYPTNKPTTYVFSTSVTTLTGYSVWVSFSEIVANTINRVANTINRVLQELPWEKNKIIVIIKYFLQFCFQLIWLINFPDTLKLFSSEFINASLVRWNHYQLKNIVYVQAWLYCHFSTVQLFLTCTRVLSTGSLSLCQHSAGDHYHAVNQISLIKRSGFD